MNKRFSRGLSGSVLSGSVLFMSAAAWGADWSTVVSSRNGGDWEIDHVSVIAEGSSEDSVVSLQDPSPGRREILGIGGAFTESSAAVLSRLSNSKRSEVLEACFSPEEAAYSLMRTHIASCDFSLGNYTYWENEDAGIESFSLSRDRELLLPLIKDAQSVKGASFRVVASPWTPPPWMKDNGRWNGGTLKEEHYETFAEYLGAYLRAYDKEGVPVWGLTPINEPEGNGVNWESCHFTAEEMTRFVGDHLLPSLKREALDTKVFVFDQNRDHAEHWAEVMYADPQVRSGVSGMAVHWYSDTVDPKAEVIENIANTYRELDVIHSEGCIDALGDDEEEGVWLERDWYWRAEATDWGWIWAPEELKKDHPKYRPVSRYATDLIVGLNAGLTGWIDWNLCLDFNGGPNHANNFCGAPVLVDGESDTVYYTPLYFVMRHFSQYVRPGGKVMDMAGLPVELIAVAVRNVDGSTVFVCYNEGESEVEFGLRIGNEVGSVRMPSQSIRTVVVK